MKKKGYVVFAGRTPGVYATWSECQAQVNGFSGCSFCSCPSMEEAFKTWNDYQRTFNVQQQVVHHEIQPHPLLVEPNPLPVLAHNNELQDQQFPEIIHPVAQQGAIPLSTRGLALVIMISVSVGFLMALVLAHFV